MLKLFLSVFFVFAVFQSSVQSNNSAQKGINGVTPHEPEERALQDSPTSTITDSHLLRFIRSSSTICEAENDRYRGREITQIFVKDFDHCSQLCAMDSLCKVFFVIDRLSTDGRYLCSLKQSVQFTDDDTKHFKACKNRDLLCIENSQYTRDERTAPLFRGCYIRCFNESNCNAFYLKDNAHNQPICHTLTAWPRQKPASPGYILGTMDCSRPTFTVSDYIKIPDSGSTICEGNPIYKLYYSGKELAVLNVKDQDHCRDLCADADCKIFMITETLPNNRGYKCLLIQTSLFGADEIQTLKNRILSNACVDRSFTCFENNVKYGGGFLLSGTVASLRDCYTKCFNMRSCKAFYTQYIAQTGGQFKCYLSTTWQDSKANASNYVSGPMNCPQPDVSWAFLNIS